MKSSVFHSLPSQHLDIVQEFAAGNAVVVHQVEAHSFCANIEECGGGEECWQNTSVAAYRSLSIRRNCLFRSADVTLLLELLKESSCCGIYVLSMLSSLQTETVPRPVEVIRDDPRCDQ